jgi:hypothetical protein
LGDKTGSYFVQGPKERQRVRSGRTEALARLDLGKRRLELGKLGLDLC